MVVLIQGNQGTDTSSAARTLFKGGGYTRALDLLAFELELNRDSTRILFDGASAAEARRALKAANNYGSSGQETLIVICTNETFKLKK